MNEGQLEGRQEGEKIGRIRLLQEMLGLRVWTAEELASCEMSQLISMADQLQEQLRSGNS